MKKLLSRWIAAIMVSVMVISSGVTGTVQAEGNHVETTEEKLQTDTEKNNSEIEGDLSVGDDATSQKEDDSMTEENSVTESEVIKEGAVNEENVGKNPESTEVSEDTEPEESEEIEMALNYLYINEAEQQEGEQQSIVLSWGNENTQVNNISLTLENENGEQTILEATKKSDELYLYEHIFSQGVYHVSNVHVATDESEKDFTAEELEIDAYFGVGKTPNESAKSSYIEMESVEEGEDSANTAASVETSVVSIGENGEETAEASIGAAMEAQGVTARSGKARSARAKNVVVVLDPGHDSKHAGASGNSVHEEVATLKIAKYCKEELEQYGGITVYMTRESAACPFPNSKDNIDDIKQRTAWAKTKGADVFVSFHLNSNNSSSPNGAEVYYPKTSSGGAALAQKIQGELVALGLKNRGTKANETLAVINSSMRNGFPGVLIEHAFVSNSSDANNYLNSDAKLKKLGVADAKGIASYFGLSKGKWVQDSKGWKYEVNGKYVISQWMTIGGEKYYFDAEGYRVIGWQTIRSQKYYFMPDGHMHTGWLSFGDTYYYMMPDGHMHTGWLSFGDIYYYLNKEGIRQTGWQTIEGQKYYFMPDGHMHTGWLSFGDTYYYMMPDGHMHTGWQIIGGKEYYFGQNGICVENAKKNGWTITGNKRYYFRDGEMQIGWQTIEGQKYYFMPDGHMHAGWLSFGDTYYYMMPDGHMHTGWLSFGDTYYYLNKEGIRQTGWQTIEGKEYYFDKNGIRVNNVIKNGWTTIGTQKYYFRDGEMQIGWQTIEGQKYYFMPDGHMHAGWLSFGDTYYYMMPDGHMHTGWLSFGDTYYYLNKEGIRQTGWQTIEDQRYYFMPDAHMHIGWLSFGDTYYYMMPDGHMHTGWLSFGNTYYYMDNDGVRVTGWQTIDGKDYYFDLNGVRKDGYPIEGKSEVTISQMLKMYQKQNKLYPSQALAKGGAPTIEDFVNIVYQEASAEGIKAEVVFCQSMLETGWLQFGGDVKVEQFNFAGLGATGGGVAGADFSSYGKEGVRIGIRAQVQHLKCYANKKPLINPCVDPRWGEWLRGKAPYVEWLGIKENPYGTGWAAGANYGNNIVKLIKSTKLL